MASAHYASYSADGPQVPMTTDWTVAGAAITVASLVSFGAGVGTYTIEYTLDDVNGALPVRWIADAGATNVSVDKVLNYQFPIRAVRMNITVYTSGSFELKVVGGF